MIANLLASLFYYLIPVLIGIVTATVIYIRWHYGTLEKLKGVNAVVKPSFIGGSDFAVYKKVVHDEDSKNVEKYGKIFGYYEGRGPMIFISDPELIRLIFIKDFDHFHDKRILDFGHELINEMMDVLPYDKWKPVRSFISPTLTTGKIRNMSVPMMDAINEWVAEIKIKMEKNEPFLPKKMFTALTGSVIARCAFATKVNCFDDSESSSEFFKHMKGLTFEDGEINFMLSMTHLLPFMSKYVPFFPGETLEFFGNVIKNVMKSRRENNIRVNDFIDCLNDLMEKVENDPEYKRLGINETTVMCQALVFFFAGFETTSTTLSLVTYNLSRNPSVQSKLLQELDSYLERHSGKIEHETINELTYMAACVQETLRMFPPLIRLERVCTKEWKHEQSGLVIPKGMAIQVPVYHMHYNEAYYPDPNEFKPERFLPENKDKLNPYNFLSFGQGNHNCVGMRFAKEEMYLALASIMKTFKFQPNEKTKLKFQPGRTFVIAFEPFSVDAVKRQ